MSDICPRCNKSVSNNSRAIECDVCLNWFHLRCSLLSVKQYNYIAATNDLIRQQCRVDTFPFSSINDSDLVHLTFNSNTTCYCSNQICNHKLDCLPRLAEIVNLSTNSSTFDIESNITPQVNFGYFSSHNFHSNPDISGLVARDSFSVLHCNIRSLMAYYLCYLT